MSDGGLSRVRRCLSAEEKPQPGEPGGGAVAERLGPGGGGSGVLLTAATGRVFAGWSRLPQLSNWSEVL